MSKNAAVVVLFNPELTTIKSIYSYLQQVELIYVINNSTEPLCDELIYFIRSNNRLQFVDLNENKGIAYALNIGCRLAIKDGFEWILTMDQDTIVDPQLISKFEQFKQTFSGCIGMLAPVVELFGIKKEFSFHNRYEQVSAVITSGSFLNLDAYQLVGGFDDQLFIDWVDWDICLRLRLQNYPILQVNNCKIKHQLGRTVEFRLFGKHVAYITHHNCVRYYYKTRNALFLASKNKVSFYNESFYLKKSVWYDFLKIVLFENDKKLKLIAIYKGWKDFKNNTFRKYE